MTRRTHLVERVTLARMEKGGLTRDDVALLLDAGSHGDPTAWRVLARAAGGLLGGYEAPDGRGMAVAAMVELAPGLGWCAGELFDPHGRVPSTVATAMVDRPVRDLLVHPDVDPDATVSPPSRGGALAVPMEVVALTAPRSPLARLRAWRILANRRGLETGVSTRTKAIMSGAAAISCLNLGLRGSKFLDTSPVGIMASALTIISALIVVLLAIDLVGGRWITCHLARRRGRTPPYEALAERAMRDWESGRHRERGFDASGRPV